MIVIQISSKNYLVTYIPILVFWNVFLYIFISFLRARLREIHVYHVLNMYVGTAMTCQREREKFFRCFVHYWAYIPYLPTGNVYMCPFEL